MESHLLTNGRWIFWKSELARIQDTVMRGHRKLAEDRLKLLGKVQEMSYGGAGCT